MLLVLGAILLLLPFISSTPLLDAATPASYSGYKLIATSPLENHEMAAAITLHLEGKEGVQLWNSPKANHPLNILVSPANYPEVRDFLEALGTKNDVVMEDVEEHIRSEKEAASSYQLGKQSNGHGMDWKSYHRYTDIYNYCRHLADSKSVTKSGAFVTMSHIGKTTERREIVVVKLTDGKGQTDKPAIWMDGGMHAREWISPAVVTYILNILVTDRNRSQELLNAFDWYIVPVINVDGYEFSHTGDRMWRKTRARTSIRICRGVDPNRNWAYLWGGEGSSKNPCDETYCGTRAFSEPETKSVANAILARKQIKMYLSFHSYSQILLVPWGGRREKPADYNELRDLALKGAQALQVNNGTKYEVGTAADLLEVATGGSDDWAKSGAGIKYSYTFELRDTGKTGFLLPARQIVPSGEETFDAVKSMALNLKDNLKGNP